MCTVGSRVKSISSTIIFVVLSMKVDIALIILCVAVKVLLIPSYRSTDFEVHRNWLAITYDLPLKEWYFDTTSIWTLDYPPFFAYFQWLLAQVAVLIDPAMVKIDSLNYASSETILFLRGSVIVVDLLLIYASWLFLSRCERCSNLKRDEKLSAHGLVIFNAGLLLVDHIHFQFNGMLMGVLVFCIYFASTQRYLALTCCFSCLVLMKHLFVPLAPIFGVYLIQRHCYIASGNSAEGKTSYSFSMVRFLQLVLIAVVALAAAFGPFLLQDNGKLQLPQIFSRLFPFGRGLVHAYWAPNVWSLYCFADKIGFILLSKFPSLQRWVPVAVSSVSSAATQASSFGSSVDSIASSSTSGLVGDFVFQLLPRVTAGQCLLLLLLSLLPALWVVWRRPTVASLTHALVYGSLCSFMLGYHVHEKAVIIPWLLQTFVVFESQQNKVLFLILSGAGGLGLFPLFSGLPELLVKASLLAAYLLASWYALCEMSLMLSKWKKRLVLLCWALLGVTFVFSEIIHPVAFLRPTGAADGSKELFLPFLPLMVTSVVCAVQLVGCWLLSLQVMLRSQA